MSRQKRDFVFWLTIFVVLFGQVVLMFALWQNSTHALAVVGWITGAVIPALVLLYGLVQKRSLRLFLWANKIRSRFSSRVLTWKMSAILQDEEITEYTLDQIIEKLYKLRNPQKDITVKHINKKSRIVFINPGPTLEITYNPPRPSPINELGGLDLPYIQISIKNYRVGYAQTEQVIKQEIAPILETVTGVTHNANAKYNFVIEFDKNENPFYGLYIAHLPPEAISKFSIRLAIDSQEPRDTVLISESQVTINTRTQSSLRNLALEFLSFDSKLQEHLTSVQ